MSIFQSLGMGGKKPGPWTVFLVVEATTDKNVLNSQGRSQVAAAAEHIRSMSTDVSEVWLGTHSKAHRATAVELVNQLGPDVTLRDDDDEFMHTDTFRGNRERLIAILTERPVERPIVLVAMAGHGQSLLEAAGIATDHTRRMRSSRAYPVEINHRGRVRLSSLLDYTSDAPELATPYYGPSRSPRD